MVAVVQYTEINLNGRIHIPGGREDEYLTLEIARNKVADLLRKAYRSKDWNVKVVRSGAVWVIYNDTASVRISLWW